MIMQLIKLLVTVCAVVGATVVGAQPVAPKAGSNLSRAQLGQVPKISDTLTVAKSPFEPVTLAISNLNSPESSRDIDVSSGEDLTLNLEIKKTTRAIQEESEQEQTQKPMANGEQPSSPTDEVTTTTPSPADVDVTAAGADADLDTTTTPKSVDLQRSEEKITTTTTTSSPAAESTSLPSSESLGVSSTGETNNNESATTAAPQPNLTPESSPEASSEKPAEASSEKPAEASSEKPAEASSETPNSTSTTEASQTEAPKTIAPASGSLEEETATSTPITTTTTTTEAPTSSSEPAVAEEPASSSAATTTTTTTEASTISSTSSTAPISASTTTLKPQDQKVGNKTDNNEDASGDEIKSSQACNHLPSYDTDELQKVFREETTFKNGTIKGKFTYINFDQRYRLVHYTRLPYGPVKIDLVEELGRPESSNQGNRNNQTQLTPMSAIPNAVLQLRNILPNSLFGFPFLGPQADSGGSNGIGRQQPGTVEDDGKSNTYFYTTDNISTPNLLSPSVPVSVPPTGAGQRRIVPQLNSVGPRNSLANGDGHLYEQQNSNDVLAALHKYRQQERANGEAVANMFGVPNHQQFQFAVSQPQGVQSPDPKQPGLIYSYLAQPQYQYSAPLYSFQQPAAFYPLSPHQVQTSSYSVNVNHGHHHHQPHSHEHFVAPFMFAQPPATPGSEQQSEPAKVKLVKVKTSKALNVDAQHEPIGKSAQLRSTSSGSQGIYSTPANSPAHVGRRQHQFRHRHGKQSPDLKQTVNTTPVVYHILRSPMGRMYNSPHYPQQAHSIAYDHDN